VWYTKQGEKLHPGTGYWVGGNTKVFGGALFLRERDFEQVKHQGISPAWPLKYHDFEPYYTQAEKLYQVHGQRGLDPTEPQQRKHILFLPSATSRAFRRFTTICKKGLHPFYLPLAIRLSEAKGFEYLHSL